MAHGRESGGAEAVRGAGRRSKPTLETAESFLQYAREHLAPYKRTRRIEFAVLSKAISGKIRRVELGGREANGHGDGSDASIRVTSQEFWEDDIPDLRG